MAVARKEPKLPMTGTHVSQHICWPWDIDMFRELNNGRTLTLYDMGRLPLAERTGLLKMVKREGWGLTVAGVSVRYRARVRMFDRVEMKSRAVGWDDKFLYIEQSIWKGQTCCNQILLRMATTDRAGIVKSDRVAAAMGVPAKSPDLPGWVTAWIAADNTRPWPPVEETDAISIAKSA